MATVLIIGTNKGIRLQFEVNTLGPLRVISSLRSNLCAGSKVVILARRVGSMGDNESGGIYGYRMLAMEGSGSFRHANGETLPW